MSDNEDLNTLDQLAPGENMDRTMSGGMSAACLSDLYLFVQPSEGSPHE